MVNKGSLLSQPLIEAIRPADSDGPLISVVCSTHGLDLDQPNFFEHDFVPTLLGLGGVRDRGYAIPVATERKLAESYCALVYDAHALALGGRPSLRVDVLPVSRQLNHAKIVLIHRQRLVRLIIGSANLTHAGYRTQREIAAVLDFKPGGNIAPSVLEEAVRGWIEALGEMTSPPLRDNLNEAVHAAQQLVEKQQRANTGDMTVVFGGGSEPLWQKIAAAWQHGEPLLKWYICSPFWPGPGDSETPFEKMISALSGKGCNCADAELVLVARADAPY